MCHHNNCCLSLKHYCLQGESQSKKKFPPYRWHEWTFSPNSWTKMRGDNPYLGSMHTNPRNHNDLEGILMHALYYFMLPLLILLIWATNMNGYYYMYCYFWPIRITFTHYYYYFWIIITNFCYTANYHYYYCYYDFGKLLLLILLLLY